jgi:hypothetical protein
MAIDIEKFFSDPKYENDKNFLTQAVEKILEQKELKKIEEEKKNPKKSSSEKSIFDKLWSGE